MSAQGEPELGCEYSCVRRWSPCWKVRKTHVSQTPLPCMCWGFVDLSLLPDDAEVNYGNCNLEPGIYAIVECSRIIKDSTFTGTSEIFQPISKIVGGLTNNLVSHLKFYMVTIEAFVKPVAVLPDLDGDSNAYFALKDRTEWRNDFVNWLEEPSDLDKIEYSDLEESDENSKTITKIVCIETCRFLFVF